MRAGLAIVIMIILAGSARAQSGMDPAITIPVHPSVTTILYMPDEVERARFAAPLSPTAYAGLGLQAHLRDIEEVETGSMLNRESLTRDMPFGGVLALGLGFEHRIGDVFLGVDFQIRQGVPADYRSVAVLLSVGCLLDQGE